MKRFVGACALAVGMLLQGASANAQQTQPTPQIPLPKPAHPLPRLTHFPVPAAQYDQYVQWYLQILRQMPSRYHVTQGEVDSVILLLKDCAGKIESDGYVTRTEMDYCHNVMMSKVHEIAAPYMLQAAGGR